MARPNPPFDTTALAHLAREIGAELLQMQRAAADDLEGLVLHRKGDADLVTRADLHSHRRLTDAFAALAPGVPTVFEESDRHDIPNGPFLVCDELDGTINFSRGRPEWGVSLAYVDGGPRFAAIYLPAPDLLIEATRGEGCRLNGRPARLSTRQSLRACVAGAELNPHHDTELRRRYVDPLTLRTLTTRVQACAVAAAADLLQGLTDCYLNCRGAKIWDFAATALAITEAGGIALDLAGAPLRWDAVEMGAFFAANRALADEAQGLWAEAAGPAKLAP